MRFVVHVWAALICTAHALRKAPWFLGFNSPHAGDAFRTRREKKAALHLAILTKGSLGTQRYIERPRMVAGHQYGTGYGPRSKSFSYSVSSGGAAHLMGQIHSGKSASELMAVHRQHADAFTMAHVTTFWNKLGKLASKERSFLQNYDTDLDGLREVVMKFMPRFDAYSLATVAHGMAKVGLNGQGEWSPWTSLWNSLSRKAVDILHDFNARGLTTIVYAFAVAEQEAPEFYQAFAGQITKFIDRCTPQGIANTAWAFAKVGHDEPDLFQALATQALAQIHDFNQRDLAITAWAFGKGQHDSPRDRLQDRTRAALFAAIAKQAMLGLPYSDPYDLAMIAWAFAKAGHDAPELFSAIAEKVEIISHRLAPKDVTNLAWAFATVRYESHWLYKAFARMVDARQCDAQQISNLAWALAKVQQVDFDLFYDLANQAVRKMHDFNAQAISNTAWAYATAGHAAPELFEALADQALKHVGKFTPQGLSNLLWAFATAGVSAPLLFEVLASQVTKCIHELSPQNIANIAWAYVTAGHKAPMLLEANARESDIDENAEDREMLPHVVNLLDALRSEARRRLDDFDLEYLLSLYWAFSFARLLSGEFEKEIIGAAMRMGRLRDDDENATQAVGHFVSRDLDKIRGREVPYVLSEGAHWLAVYKPSGWLLDTNRQNLRVKDDPAQHYGTMAEQVFEMHTRKAKRMQAWIQQTLQDRFHICRDPAEAHGLVHRLDAETSGLVLCAKTYAGANWLRLQWHGHAVEKEYICLVHGWLDKSICDIHKPILIEQREIRDRSNTFTDQGVVSPFGKPSHTQVISVAHLGKESKKELRRQEMASQFEKALDGFDTGGSDIGNIVASDPEPDEEYSLVAVRLHTGRRHQIRVHLSSMGHPVVRDLKYGEDEMSEDREWCPRNFLHLYCVGFKDSPIGDFEGCHCHISCPMPEDLRESLKLLRPADEQSAIIYDVFAGDVEADDEEFDSQPSSSDSVDVNSIPPGKRRAQVKDSVDSIPPGKRRGGQVKDSVDVNRIPRGKRRGRVKDSVDVNRIPRGKRRGQVKDSVDVNRIPPGMRRGQVKSFKPGNGYGFLHGEHGDIFFNKNSHCVKGYLPHAGDIVFYKPVEEDGKPVAMLVELAKRACDL